MACDNCINPQPRKPTGKGLPPRPALPEDNFIDDDVKAYVAARYNPNDTPLAAVTRNYAAQVQTTKLLRIMLTELHMLRLAYCRHQPGFCEVNPCVQPRDPEDLIQ